MWLLDTDYDERSLFPRQVFFPLTGGKEGWYKLKKDIRAELNEDLLNRCRGTVSLPFEPGDNQKVAVKIVDPRDRESKDHSVGGAITPERIESTTSVRSRMPTFNLVI